MAEQTKLNANPKVVSTFEEPVLAEDEAHVLRALDQLIAAKSPLLSNANYEYDEDDEGEDNDNNAGRQAISAEEVFDLIRNIKDPEHPLSLEELNVVQCEGIRIDDAKGRIDLFFTPTVPHCSMSTLIGLCLRVRLLRALPPRYKVDIYVEPGSHVSESQVNRQLNDKERVAAALENAQLLNVVNGCLARTR